MTICARQPEKHFLHKKFEGAQSFDKLRSQVQSTQKDSSGRKFKAYNTGAHQTRCTWMGSELTCQTSIFWNKSLFLTQEEQKVLQSILFTLIRFELKKKIPQLIKPTA